MVAGGRLSRKQKGKAVATKSSPAREADGTPLDDFEQRLLVYESARLHRREVARTTTEAQVCARDGQDGARDGTPPVDFVPICYYSSRIFEELLSLSSELLRSLEARGQTWGNVLSTRSTVGSMKRLLRECRGVGITFLIPTGEQRPRRDTAISQFLNGSWRLVVALMVMAAEIDVTLNVRASEELTSVKPLDEGLWSVKMRPNYNVVKGYPNKTMDWQRSYFFVKSDDSAFEDPPDDDCRVLWNALLEFLSNARAIARLQPERWGNITRDRFRRCVDRISRKWTAAYEEMVVKRKRAIARRKIHHLVAEADLRVANSTILALEMRTCLLEEKIGLEAKNHKKELEQLRESRVFEVTKDRVRVETEMIAKSNKRFANIREYQARRASLDTMNLLQNQAFGTRKCLEALKAGGRDIPQKTIDMFAAQEKQSEEEALKLDVGEIPEADLSLSPFKLDSQFVDERVMVGLDPFGSNASLIDARTAASLHTPNASRDHNVETPTSEHRSVEENAPLAPDADHAAILLLSDSSAESHREDQEVERSADGRGDRGVKTMSRSLLKVGTRRIVKPCNLLPHQIPKRRCRAAWKGLARAKAKNSLRAGVRMLVTSRLSAPRKRLNL
ncbi:hypothetical protein N665_0217s0018 [Sinapis alba]|nr:hypothetical protein N665_0217s0018 [Sinapis alba]